MTEEYKGTIIHADDDEIIRRVIGTIASTYFSGHTFESFSDGTSLESRLNQGIQTPAAILTDNKMPGLSGSEFISKYARDPRFNGKIPFVLVYAGVPEIGEKAEKDGAYRILRKPFLLKDIISVVQNALDYSASQTRE